MSLRKSVLIAAILCLNLLGVSSQTITNYARMGMKTTFEIDWDAYNYGTIQWQRSLDNGTNWNDIPNAVNPWYEYIVNSDGLFRAKISTQPECEPTYITRSVKTVDFSVDLTAVSAATAVFEISKMDFKDAKIVEVGYCYNLADLSPRNYQNMQLVKIGNSIPADSIFELTCENLVPGTSYSIRVYFKTQDGSMIYGPGRMASTLSGLKWTSENWQINKTSLAARFELAGYNSTMGNSNVVFKFGSNAENLQQAAVTDLGNFKYSSPLIGDLTTNTTYIAQAEAIIDGEKQTITKEVKTLPDYSDVPVDETTNPVKHTIRWDATMTLHPISPKGLQTEYPRIIRLSPDTLLCSYHGGTASDYWINIYLQRSFDNGQTWTSPAILMDKEKSAFGSHYWRFCNPEMTRLKNGWVLMSFVGNGNPDTNDNSHVMVMRSKDNGQTWSDPLIIGHGRTWEPTVTQLPNGELELYVSSEAAWYQQSNDVFQEILYSRSTDNGETWTEFKRACYAPNRRDGMPSAIVMQGNKGILFSIETVNDGGFGSPSMVHRPLNGEWDATPWNGISTDKRWNVNVNAFGGAPYTIQLPTGEIVVSAHVNGRNGVWQTSYPRIVVGDSNGKNFTTPVTPITNLPASEGAYYNSLFLKDSETVWLVITHSFYNGSTRLKGEIVYLEGKIVDKK